MLPNLKLGHSINGKQTLRAMSRASYLSLQYRDGLISHGVFTQLAVLLEQLLGPPVDAGQGNFLLEKALDALLSFFIEDPLLDFHQVKEKSLEVFQCFISMVLLPFSSTRKYFIT